MLSWHLRIVLIHCAICGYMTHAIDSSRGFWYSTLPTFEIAKLLTASTSAIEWYKSCDHILFLSEILIITYVPTHYK